MEKLTITLNSTCNIMNALGRVGVLAMTVMVIAIIGFFIHDAYTVSLNGTTTVTPNPATAVLGAPITFHVKVVDTSATKIIATGTVSWSDGGVGELGDGTE